MSDTLSVGAACSRKVVCTGKGASVAEAARTMRERHVGSLVVVEESAAGPVPAGMLTDRDIVISVVARGSDPGSVRVAEVMSGAVLTVSAADTIGDALALMRRHGVRRVPVTAADGTLCGIVSLDDLLRCAIDDLRGFVLAIESGEWREASTPERAAGA
jgi:CBS domain-containing protein